MRSLKNIFFGGIGRALGWQQGGYTGDVPERTFTQEEVNDLVERNKANVARWREAESGAAAGTIVELTSLLNNEHLSGVTEYLRAVQEVRRDASKGGAA